MILLKSMVGGGGFELPLQPVISISYLVSGKDLAIIRLKSGLTDTVKGYTFYLTNKHGLSFLFGRSFLLVKYTLSD